MKTLSQTNPVASRTPDRNRETEQQRNSDTERLSQRATERKSDIENREPDETDDTHDSALAACVKTLQEAAQIALANKGISENCLFDFARAVKAFEITNKIRLPRDELANAFGIWWNAAKPQLPGDADFDEYALIFEDAYERAKSPLGSNALNAAIERADTQPLPPAAAAFSNAKIRRLIAVCYQLQQLSDASPFFLSVRDAQRVLETPRLGSASAILNGLVSRRILEVVQKGTPGGRRATRFRFRSAFPAANTRASGVEEKT